MKVFRALSGLLGLVAIFMGVVFLIFPEKEDFWGRWVVPIGFLGTGWYFLGYALTGTVAFFWYRSKSRPKIDADGCR